MCPWQTSSPLTPPSPEWLAGTPWWWFNIISEHDWLCALETRHYTAPCRVLMFWKTRYHLFILASFTHRILCKKRSGNLAGKEETTQSEFSTDVLRFAHFCLCVHKCLENIQEENKKQKPSPCFCIKVIHRCIQSAVFHLPAWLL